MKWLTRIDLLPVVHRLPRYVRLGWGLARDRRLSLGQRALLVAGLAYLASPLDLIPGFIPVLGQMDDLTITLWAMRRVLGRLPDAVRDEHLARAGLTLATLDADLGRLRRAAVLAAGVVATLGTRAAAGVGSLAWQMIRRLVPRRP